MKRRAFLRALGGAVAAGPTAAKSAATATMADLNLRAMGVSAVSSMDGLAPAPAMPGSPETYARSQLRRLLGMTRMHHEMRRQRYCIDGLEPDIACLRSVSLANKIRMSRSLAYDRSVRRERGYLEGVIERLWD